MRFAAMMGGMIAVLVAAPVAAQAPTGTTGVGTQDPNWTVSWTATALGGGGNSGGAYNAYVVNPVAGVWQPNTAGGPSWISAWRSASAGNGVGDYNRLTDAGHRYTYTFSNSFLSGPGTFRFTAGWDNLFETFILNGTSYDPQSLLVAGPAVVTDYFGFCRNGDGMLPTAGYPNCTATFEVGGLQNGMNTVAFVLKGDGRTDGLYAFGETPGGPVETVPEPATMTLLATGLAGMAAARRRRRSA